MRKMIFVLVLLLLASPALARVDITADANGGTVYVYYSMAGADTNLPRAFGLNIECVRTVPGNPNEPNILSVGNLNPNFNIYPGSIDINNTTGEVDDYGTPVNSLYGLAGPNDSNGMTIEMGSLYVGSPNAPPSSGLILSFVVDKNCTVNISGNAARGNVVMEDVSINADPNYGTVTVDCACPGDIDGGGWITLQDLIDVYLLLGQNGGNPISDSNSLWDPCADIDGGRWITLQDLIDVYLILGTNNGNPIRTQCQISMK